MEKTRAIREVKLRTLRVAAPSSSSSSSSGFSSSSCNGITID